MLLPCLDPTLAAHNVTLHMTLVHHVENSKMHDDADKGVCIYPFVHWLIHRIPHSAIYSFNHLFIPQLCSHALLRHRCSHAGRSSHAWWRFICWGQGRTAVSPPLWHHLSAHDSLWGPPLLAGWGVHARPPFPLDHHLRS